jgi:membrane peptidoglycan carboxypeptidase
VSEPRSPSGVGSPLSAVARLGAFLFVALVAGAVAAAMVLPLATATGLITRGAVESFQSLPSQLDAPDLPERSVILASDGSVLATIYYQNRVEVPLAAVSPIMRQAVVAVEDARFLDHQGIDLRGTMRAIVANASATAGQQGGSTITQQYVKNLLIASASNEAELEAARARTPSRKLREIRYALALERRYSKDEILERYLNIVYFGAGAYGVEAAARRYFSKPAAELDLVESATLAGIIQQPTAFDPTRNPDLAQKRRNLVLDEMAEAGFITAIEASAAKRVSMKGMLDPSLQANGCTSSYAPYFCDFVIRMIKADAAFGETLVEREALLRRGGLTIRTSLDPDVQDAAMKAVTSYIPIKDSSQRAAAITLVEPGTGNILAMAQNRAWGLKGRGKTTYNYNVDQQFGGTIGMQAGSTFKVFTLAEALENGFSPLEEVDAPNPKTFENFVNCTDGTPFSPVTVRNSGSSGVLNMFQATAFSTNTYFVSLAEQFGLCRQAEIAEQMGVRLATGDPLLRVPTFPLGTMEVSPLAMAGAYATFANHGEYCQPRVVLEIKDRKGNEVNVPAPRCREVISRGVADAVTAVLTNVIDGDLDGRTGAAMSLPDRPAAGKTGSTNDNAAIWFAGFTPQVAAAVWVGDPRGGFAYPMTNVTINGQYYSYVTGGQIPGPIWREAMIAAHANLAPKPFELFNEWGIGPVRGVGPSPVYIPVLPSPEETKEPKPEPEPTRKPKPQPTRPNPQPSPTPEPTVDPEPTPEPTPTPAPAETDQPRATDSAPAETDQPRATNSG